jgi:hypothetical protein
MSSNHWTWHILLQLQCACDFTRRCHLTLNVLTMLKDQFKLTS